ncbi:hypothetical protein BH23PAT1_BH23PAT1_4220 [soil metagenome]
MLVFAISFITFLFLLITGTVVFINNPKNKVNISLAISLMFIGAWLLGVAGLTTQLGDSILYGRIVFSSAMLGLYVLYVFAYYVAVTNNVNPGRFPSPVMAGGLSALFLALAFSPLLITRVVVVGGGRLPEPVFGPAYPLLVMWMVLTFILLVAILLRTYRKAVGTGKSQIFTMMLGLFFSVVLAFATNVAAPSLLNSSEPAKLTPLSAIVLAFALSYAVIKHGFLDIRFIVARAVGYALSIFSLGWIYGLTAYLLLPRIFFPELDLTRTQEVFFAITAVIIALTFQPLKRFFDRVTNKLFYQDAYDGQALIDQLNAILVTNVDLDNLIKRSADLIGRNLKSKHCSFLINETAYMPRRIISDKQSSFKELDTIKETTEHLKQQIIVTDELEDNKLKRVLQKNDIAGLARLTTTLKYDIEGTGFLILGEKMSGNPYNSQDIRIIRIIANEMVIAIQNALRYEEIEKFNITLLEKVDTATRQLRKSNEKLKAMDEAKDEFISMASHQLRTPLTSVKGYLSMVLEGDAGKVPPAQQKFINQAFVSSQRMAYLISDLLNISRLRTGKFIIDSIPTNLAEVIEGEIGQLRETAESRKLKLIYKKPANFPELTLDEVKIRQVIMNFIDNAIYYTPAGGRVEVTLADTGQVVEFKVIDNGIGVPRSEQHQLFNKFYRAGNARKARPDGTGLGLFMAKKVITAQGGNIIFQSREGMGSTFGFAIPKKKLITSDEEPIVETDSSK